MEAALRTLRGEVHDAAGPRRCSVRTEKATVHWGKCCTFSHDYRY
jgi:hypothetical protein